MLKISRRIGIVWACVWLIAGALQGGRTRTDSGPFDGKIYVDPSLRLIHTCIGEDGLDVPPANIVAIHQMLAELGPSWRATYEKETDRAILLEGGAMPWIPGAANRLSWEDYGDCRDISCIPPASVEDMALEFLAMYADAVNLCDFELTADPVGCGPRGGYIYLLRFALSRNGLPIDSASVFFRINNGNLIQVGFETVGTHPVDAASNKECPPGGLLIG